MKRKSIRTIFRDYMVGKIKLEKYQVVGIMMLLVVFFYQSLGWKYLT